MYKRSIVVIIALNGVA